MTFFNQSANPTLFAPRSGDRTLIASAFLVLIGSLVVTLTAQVSVELRVGPVPISGQTLGVLLVGAALGSRLGAAAIVTYLLEGVSGLPVFSGGNSGWAYFTGPTCGYLLGFVAAAFVVGWLAERGWDRSVLLTALAMVIGNVVIYIAGVTWLQRFVGWDGVWNAGVEPFLAGDALKIGIASGLLPGAWWVRKRLLGE